MKNKTTKPKFRSFLGGAGPLSTRLACLGAVFLICSSAVAQNLFVSVSGAEWGNPNRGSIYKFTPNGARTTFAVGLNYPSGLAFDSRGSLFVADYDNNTNTPVIYTFTPTGVRSTFASGLSGALAFDNAGNLFVADGGSGSILKFTPGGARSTFVSGLDGGGGLAFDRAGNLFVTDGGSIVGPGHGHLYKFTPNGVRSTLASGFITPGALAFDSTGNLFLVDGGDIDGLGNAIYKFTPNGVRTTFANFGDLGVAIDSANNLFVPYFDGNIYKFTPAGVHSVFANIPSNFQSGITPGALAFQPTTPTPTPGPPVVTTNSATFVASFSATLDASLNPHGLSTTFHFQYGTTTAYGLTTAPQTQTGNTPRNVTANINSLTANTTYHFRIVASNADGTRMGADRVFTTRTMTGPPVVIARPASSITGSSATLHGSLDPHGLTTTVHFQYGTTTSYGHHTANQTDTGNTYRNIASNITGLAAHTTYHFRIVATNTGGARMGADKTFATP